LPWSKLASDLDTPGLSLVTVRRGARLPGAAPWDFLGRRGAALRSGSLGTASSITTQRRAAASFRALISLARYGAIVGAPLSLRRVGTRREVGPERATKSISVETTRSSGDLAARNALADGCGPVAHPLARRRSANHAAWWRHALNLNDQQCRKPLREPGAGRSDATGGGALLRRSRSIAWLARGCRRNSFR